MSTSEQGLCHSPPSTRAGTEKVLGECISRTELDPPPLSSRFCPQKGHCACLVHCCIWTPSKAAGTEPCADCRDSKHGFWEVPTVMPHTWSRLDRTTGHSAVSFGTMLKIHESSYPPGTRAAYQAGWQNWLGQSLQRDRSRSECQLYHLLVRLVIFAS